MGGPARRVVEYNFEHYRKKGVGWPIIVCGKGFIWKVIASVKRFTDVEKYQRGNSVWVSLPRFLTKGEFCCSICNENFPKVLPVHLGRGGMALLRNAGLGVQKLVASCFYLTGVGVGHSSV